MSWDGTSHSATATRIRLTKREIEILLLAIEGISSQTIGEKLFISRRTVEWHLQSVYDKLQVNSRLQAYRRAIRLGFVRADSSL